MPAAARVGDPTSAPGAVVGAGASTVLIGGRPAAVVGNMHVCGHPSPHPPTSMPLGSTTVFFEGRPALRTGDSVACGGATAAGDVTVLIGG